MKRRNGRVSGRKKCCQAREWTTISLVRLRRPDSELEEMRWAIAKVPERVEMMLRFREKRDKRGGDKGDH